MVRRAVIVAALALCPAAPAQTTYPPPGRPAAGDGVPRGPFSTHRVCRGDRVCHRRIQDAVDAAQPGDTIRIAGGVWRESVWVVGARKRHLRIVGDVGAPRRVVLDVRGLRPARRQDAVLVNGADAVTIRGITLRGYAGSGVHVTNVTGYRLSRLRAEGNGAYGIHVTNSKGGVIADTVVFGHGDAGVSVSGTPPQVKPMRTIVDRVAAHTNARGFSGANARYVTVTRSDWFNNAVGIVLAARAGERYPPGEHNVISANRVFWNNFDASRGAPFRLRERDRPPAGTGVLLLGGRRNLVLGNDVFGHYLVAIAGLYDPVAGEVRANRLGRGGSDLNARDLLYDGSGSDNCWAPNVGVRTIVPQDGSTFASCPLRGPNALRLPVREEAVAWLASPAAHWIRHPHVPRRGVVPLERWRRGSRRGDSNP